MAHDVSTLEREQIRRQTLRNWLLSSPALALLVVAAAGLVHCCGILFSYCR